MTWNELKTHLHRESDEHQVNFELDAIAFTIEEINSDNSVLLFADFEPLPETFTDDFILREMLEANHMFAGTNGASLSIDPDTLRASIQQTLWIDYLDFDSFMIHMKTFVDMAQHWKQIISHAIDALPEAVEPSAWLTNEGFIRV